jgi:hypothetical protein
MMTSTVLLQWGMMGPELLAIPFFLLGLLGTVFWLWMLIDCLTRKSADGTEKLIWVLVIIFTNLVGALLYFFIQRPKHRGA